MEPLFKIQAMVPNVTTSMETVIDQKNGKAKSGPLKVKTVTRLIVRPVDELWKMLELQIDYVDPKLAKKLKIGQEIKLQDVSKEKTRLGWWSFSPK